MSLLTAVMGLAKALGTDNTPSYLKTDLAAALDKIDVHHHAGGTDGNPVQAVTATKRVQAAQGANVASANNLTLGLDGNYFVITGGTQVNLLDSTGWQGGSIVVLKISAGLTIKYNQTPSGAFKQFLLAGNVDFVAAANATIALVYDSGVGVWFEIGRKA